MNIPPHAVVVRASDDEVKRDLELTCEGCKEVLCDVQDEDDLYVLVTMATEHLRQCPTTPPCIRQEGDTLAYVGPPHPDYRPTFVWSQPHIEGLVLAAIVKAETPKAAVTALMEVFNSAGYDSMDREMAFWITSQVKSWDYEDLYDIWVAS